MQTLDYQTAFHGRSPLVSVNRMARQAPMALHSHNFSELVLVTGGKGRHCTENREVMIQERNLFVMPKGRPHGYRDCHELSLINILYHSEPLGMDRTDIIGLPGYHALFRLEPDESTTTPHLRLPQAPWQELLDRVNRLEKEQERGEGGCLTYARVILMEIIIEVSRACSGAPLNNTGDTGRLAHLFSYIDENLHRRLTTPDLAQVANMSLSTLQRRFREITGETLTAAINRLRIERADDLLRETALSVTEVAFRVGFEDGNYFSKVYRRLMGRTPSEVRKTT